MNVIKEIDKSKLAITTYPDFTPVVKDVFNEYLEFIKEFPQHCDFTLNNMLIWLENESSLEMSWLNECIVLKVSDSIYKNNLGDGRWMSVLGSNDTDAPLDTLFTTGVNELKMVPDYFVEKIEDQSKYKITEDLDNKDYILNIDDLVHSSGKVYQNFRHQISYFLKNYSELALLKVLDLSSTTDINEIINALHTWPISSFSSDGNDPARVDARAIDRLFKLQNILPVKHQCLGLYIDGQLQGFSIFHVPISNSNIAMGNHIKFNSEYKRLFDFLVFATANRLREQGVIFLNAEQDMGIEGIRYHKSDLNPELYYRKYIIQPR